MNAERSVRLRNTFPSKRQVFLVHLIERDNDNFLPKHLVQLLLRWKASLLMGPGKEVGIDPFQLNVDQR